MYSCISQHALDSQKDRHKSLNGDTLVHTLTFTRRLSIRWEWNSNSRSALYDIFGGVFFHTGSWKCSQCCLCDPRVLLSSQNLVKWGLLGANSVCTCARIASVCACVVHTGFTVAYILVVTALSASLFPPLPVLCHRIPGSSQPNSLDICLHHISLSLGVMPGLWSLKISK